MRLFLCQNDNREVYTQIHTNTMKNRTRYKQNDGQVTESDAVELRLIDFEAVQDRKS